MKLLEVFVFVWVLFGKHFFGPRSISFGPGSLLMDLTFLLGVATLLLDLRALLLDLTLSQTIPTLDRFPVSVQPRLDRNSSNSRGLELH